ncbi:MAG: oxygenase MpaB family protein [Pseudobdellovibrio sp.]
MTSETKWSDSVLNKAQLQGDPSADRFLSQMINSWQQTPTSSQINNNFTLLQQAISLLKPISTNGNLKPITTNNNSTEKAESTINQFITNCESLPSWADLQKIERAETLFKDSGVLACVLFFCSSLPEVYVVPDISAVLHATGNLEKSTDLRIRTTAIMILTVLMKGGLHNSSGGGRPQILKARFIHTILRNLLLRNNPEDLMMDHEKNKISIHPIKMESPPKSMLDITFSNGWDLATTGIPCNQEELGYTLLTFSYVYLRSLRRLGLAFSATDEIAYLHCWNVIGHILGIETYMMANTMEEAEFLFNKLQRRSRAKILKPDPRPTLGDALMSSIEKSISFDSLKPMASLITKYLTSQETSADLELDKRITFFTKIIFFIFIRSVKLIDLLVRLFNPNFSIARLIIRIAGYQLLNKVLTDPTQPVDLPEHLRDQINTLLHDWSHDPLAPHWINTIEDYFTIRGSWKESIRT